MDFGYLLGWETSQSHQGVESILIRPEEKVEICRDPKDNMLLEAAVAGDADYLVTGDDDLLVLKDFEGTRIVTPTEFLDALR